MIQERAWRGEWDDSGVLCGDIEEVDTIPRNPGGKHVGYVMAKSKDDASSKLHAMAQEWYRRKLDSTNAKNKSNYQARKAAGLCVSCQKPSERARCKECASKFAEWQRRWAAGESSKQPRDPLRAKALASKTDERKHDRNRARWGSATDHARTLKRLDILGPEAFRADLCERIRDAGGGAALDEYERERAKQSEATFKDAKARYAKRHAEAAE